jgi:hypothetical protein
MGREDAIQYGALMLAGYIDRFVVTAAPSLYGGVKSGQPSELF